MATTGTVALLATTEKPGGAAATESPWLAQTFNDRANPSNSRPLSPTVTSAWPNSRCEDRVRLPPRTWVISCMP